MSLSVTYRDPGLWLDLEPRLRAEIERRKTLLGDGKWTKRQGREHASVIGALTWVLDNATELRSERE